MTAVALPAASFNCSSVVDFTTMTNAQIWHNPATPAYDGLEMATLSDGKRALWAGNTDGNNRIKFTSPGDDPSRIFDEVLAMPLNASLSTNYNFGFGYKSGVVNMDSKAKYSAPDDDPSFVFNAILNYLLNSSFSTNYNFFIQQLP
jgi:hypothetical protein